VATFESLLDAVDRLPAVGAIDALAGLSRPEVDAWTHTSSASCAHGRMTLSSRE
jgi:hypothetical protein